MKDNETKEQFIVMRAQGLSYQKISERLNTSKPTLLKWSAEMAERIDEAKILAVDAVLEEYGISRVSKVRQLATILKKIEDELATRDFKDVPTDKLLDKALSTKSLRGAPTLFGGTQ